MEMEKAEKLIKRNMQVILSCKTLDQLSAAVKYSDLVYNKLRREGVLLIDNMQFICLTERSIGFAQCLIRGINEEDE